MWDDILLSEKRQKLQKWILASRKSFSNLSYTENFLVLKSLKEIKINLKVF